MNLEGLPPDALAKVLQHLSVQDVTAVRALSKRMRKACEDERVWFTMCHQAWSGVTDVRQWLAPASPGGSRSRVRPPASYQQLFHLLRLVEDLEGLWRVIGEGPEGALVSFQWSQDGMEGSVARYELLNDPPEWEAFQRVCPRRGLNTVVEWNGERNVTLKAYSSAPGDERLRLQRSSSAEAAASVSFGSAPQASAVLGSSPQGSFEFAWLEFMHGNVAKSSKQRRRSSRPGGGGGAGAPPPTLHHLRRVDRPRPTPKHPQAGLWLGNYGGDGLQVVSLSYDFSGRQAQIVAEKVTGDAGVPAGQRTWAAAAAALPLPWPAEDAAMVVEWQEEVAQAEEEAMHALGALGVLALEGSSGSEGGGGNSDEEWDMDGLGPAGAAMGRFRRRQQVISIHMGRGQVPGPQGAAAAGQHWREGRLWVHVDGTLSFTWVDAGMGRVALRRIDGDLFGAK